jgi:hypothetical protein
MTADAVDADATVGAALMMYSMNSEVLDAGRRKVTDESNSRRIRTAVVFR